MLKACVQFLPVNFIKNRTLAIHDIDTSIRKTPTSITTESKVDLKISFITFRLNSVCFIQYEAKDFQDLLKTISSLGGRTSEESMPHSLTP